MLDWLRGLRKRPPALSYEEWLNGYECYPVFLMEEIWWDVLKRETLALAGGKCKCGAEAINAHHLHYDRPLGTERPGIDLEAVCHPCHKKRHADWATSPRPPKP